MRNHKLHAEAKIAIPKMYVDKKMSADAIATQFGVTAGAVIYWLKKSGIVRRRRGQPHGNSALHLAATHRPTMLDIAWAAGVYEGEGYAGPSKRIDRGSARVAITQKARWLCDRLRALFGGSIRMPNHNDQYPCHQWQLSGARARGFLMTIYSFLSPQRQARIRMVLQVA